MKSKGTTKAFEETLKGPSEKGRYVLRLYVTGSTIRSARAILNLKRICEEHLEGRYELEVIDICQEPTLARGDQIIAAPTLIKEIPAPMRRLIGDLSDTEKVLLGLDVRRRDEVRASKTGPERSHP